MLTRLGTTPHLENLHVLWEACARTLQAFEEELFPGEPVETPDFLSLPPSPRPLCALTEPAWILHRPEVRLGWVALVELRDYLFQRYDVELHIQTFRVIDDSKLILQTIGHLIGDTLV